MFTSCYLYLDSSMHSFIHIYIYLYLYWTVSICCPIDLVCSAFCLPWFCFTHGLLVNSITSDYCVTITNMFDVIMIWYWGIWCLDKFTKIGSQVKSFTFWSTQLSYWLLKQIRIALHVSSTLDNECFNLVPKVGTFSKMFAISATDVLNFEDLELEL